MMEIGQVIVCLWSAVLWITIITMVAACQSTRSSSIPRTGYNLGSSLLFKISPLSIHTSYIVVASPLSDSCNDMSVYQLNQPMHQVVDIRYEWPKNEFQGWTADLAETSYVRLRLLCFSYCPAEGLWLSGVAISTTKLPDALRLRPVMWTFDVCQAHVNLGLACISLLMEKEVLCAPDSSQKQHNRQRTNNVSL